MHGLQDESFQGTLACKIPCEVRPHRRRKKQSPIQGGSFNVAIRDPTLLTTKYHHLELPENLREAVQRRACKSTTVPQTKHSP